ncbi:disks large-associated protein 2-like [Lampetra fluviatilis]
MKSLANTRGIMQLGPAAATNTFLHHDCRVHHDHVHQQPSHCCQEGMHGPCLVGPLDLCQGGDPHRSGYAPRNSIHSECQLVPTTSLPEPLSSSTFPRMHCPPSYYEGPEECVPFGPPPGRVNRIPPGLIDQFERQLPLHRDGFLTLQYQRTMTEHRSDSPGKIRHLVHSVQKLFTKSHSLEGAAAKSKLHGAGSIVKHHHHQNDQAHHGRHHGKRSKSRDRGKPRTPQAGWWSSDDNLDSESLCHGPVVPARYAEFPPPPPRYQLESSHSLPEQALKASKSNEDIVKCPTCVSLQAVPEGRFVKHSSWSSLTVSQAREVYSKAAINVDKMRERPPTFKPEVPRKPPELAWRVSEPPPRRLPPPELPWKPHPEMSRKVTIDKSPHYLQVPKEEWNVGKEDEIPCRRMRSGSYIKAMGDEDSGGESDSPKVSPKGASRRESYLKATGQRTMSEHAADRYRSRNESYLRAVSTVSQASCVSQFETVCESVFSEMESQAMEALDLPGCFRSRSHSYLRAIQEGYADGSDGVSIRSGSPPPPMTAISTIRASAGACYQPARTSQQICHTAVTTITTFKKPPPIPPRSAKPMISVTTQSSTESVQDAYLEPAGAGKRRNGAAATALQPVPRQRAGTRADRAGPGAGRPSPLQRTVLPRANQASPGGPAGATPCSEWGQQNYSNSSDSLDSAKALSVAMEAAAAQKHGPGEHWEKEQPEVTLVVAEPLPARCLSIGIQVDGPEQVPEAEKETKILSRFQSIGIQVEEERRLGRLGRSNSVSASVQADLEPEGYYAVDEGGGGIARDKDGSCRGGPLRRRSSETDAFMRYARRAEMRRQENVQSDDSPPEFDPWRLPGCPGGRPGGAPPPPPPEVRMSSVGDSRSAAAAASREPLMLLLAAPRASAGRRDGTWFLKLLQAERERMESWCQQMENDAEENDLPEDILGKIRSAVGSARLLMCQKFQQFQGLCHENLNPTADPHPTSQDLAGFWDMLQLAIEDVGMKFGELQQLKVNQWKEADAEEVQEEQQLPPPMSRKPSRGRSTLYRQKSAEAADRQRVEARKRLLAAKRAASMRQNSATESADSIEIYIPEAQTRL